MMEVLSKYKNDDIQNFMYSNYMGIYCLRSDDNEVIRNSATNIWKLYVENTPKLLRLAI